MPPGQNIIIVLDSWEILPGRFSGGQFGLDSVFLVLLKIIIFRD